MAEKYLGVFKKESMRLQNHDYASRCTYFITIDTFSMNKYFGDVMPAQTGQDPSIHLTAIGIIARDYWKEIPKHYGFIVLDAFVIMPNHIHGIISFNVPRKEDWEPNKFGPQRNNLGAVIGSYKAAVKRYANKNNIEFKWKDRYHELIIWKPEDLEKSRSYIRNNPIKWLEKFKK